MDNKIYAPKLLILKPSKLDDKIASSMGQEKIAIKINKTIRLIVNAFCFTV